MGVQHPTFDWLGVTANHKKGYLLLSSCIYCIWDRASPSHHSFCTKVYVLFTSCCSVTWIDPWKCRQLKILHGKENICSDALHWIDDAYSLTKWVERRRTKGACWPVLSLTDILEPSWRGVGHDLSSRAIDRYLKISREEADAGPYSLLSDLCLVSSAIASQTQHIAYVTFPYCSSRWGKVSHC